jgi:hypothetical protein
MGWAGDVVEVTMLCPEGLGQAEARLRVTGQSVQVGDRI